jgi:hypothetical protein
MDVRPVGLKTHRLANIGEKSGTGERTSCDHLCGGNMRPAFVSVCCSEYFSRTSRMPDDDPPSDAPQQPAETHEVQQLRQHFAVTVEQAEASQEELKASYEDSRR